MRKSGLHDMKRKNRQLIMRTVLESGALSRIEIAGRTELSPSTVSSLVSELLADGLLIESGVRISTAGRSRTELTVNADYGYIMVVEIGRKGIYLTRFNMALQDKEGCLLSDTLVDGNELLSLISDGIVKSLEKEDCQYGVLAGIGLLFQEDMRASDFNVMYSTGFSSASISLRESLITQYRVPVVEEYSQVYTVANALGRAADEMVRNSAHIAVGASVVASVTVEGKLLPLREGFCADMAPFLEELPAGGERARLADQREKKGVLSAQTVGRIQERSLSRLIMMLCIMFPLDTVFLSGPGVDDKLVRRLSSQIKKQLEAGQMPGIRRLEQKDMSQAADALAERVRESVLFA